jgi:quercetin dioxygenase-like cupin family protein
LDKDRVRVDTVEGVPVEGTMQLRRLLQGQHGLLLEIHLSAGTKVPEHRHDDHECHCYLVTGRLWLEINGTASLVHAGDVWLHPQGIPHSTHALDDAVWLEFKTTAQEPFTFANTRYDCR